MAKVVDINGGGSSKNTVMVLEDLLTMAKKGELEGLVVYAPCTDGTSICCYCAESDDFNIDILAGGYGRVAASIYALDRDV